jgi:cytidylate kinase
LRGDSVEALPHVLWIGGPSGSGKTTVARLIARRHGLRWYNSDAHTWSHRDRALEAGVVAAARFETLTPAERAGLPFAEQLAMSLHVERGPMTVDDVRALPTEPMTIVEGTQVVPQMLPPGSHAVWLTTSPEVRAARLAERHKPDGIPPSYLQMVQVIEAEIGTAKRLVVDDLTTAEAVAAVERYFADQLAHGPVARTVEEYRRLIRYANDKIVAQHLTYFARPWTVGDPATTVRAFDCECARSGCMAQVDITIAGFPTTAAVLALAPGHSPATAGPWSLLRS